MIFNCETVKNRYKIKMEALKPNCLDCKKSFDGLRKNGTAKKRCGDCQSTYTEKYIKKCGDCDKDYHAVQPNGRTYDKCFECYQKGFNKCTTCDKRTFKDFTLCSDCYNQEKIEKMKKASEPKPCKNNYCSNITKFTYCASCKSQKDLENKYVISTCKECGYRSSGDFTICTDCKKERYYKTK